MEIRKFYDLRNFEYDQLFVNLPAEFYSGN